MITKKFSIYYLFLMLAMATSAHPAIAASNSRGVLLDRIVAVIDDGVILKSDLDRRVAAVRRRLEQQRTQAPRQDVLRHQVLEQMINTKLQMQAAKRGGIQVSDDDLNQAIKRIAQQNRVPLTELPARLKAQGINYADFRQSVRTQMVLQQLHQQVVNDRLHITPQEIQQQMRSEAAQGNRNAQIHLSQILIAFPSNPTPLQIQQTRKKANAVRQKLKSGADFGATAVARSDGQQALQGGDLGWRRRAELPTMFADAISKLKTGDISAPIKSPSGYHILKVDGTRAGGRDIVTQTHVRHILIRPTAVLSEAQAHQRIKKIRRKLVHGASFSKLAKKYSDDPGSANSGGDLGWTDPGSFVPHFTEVVKGLKPEHISQPFKTQFGWHIVEVLGRRRQDQTNKNRKQKAFAAVRSRKSDEVLQDWIAELRSSAYIDKRLASS